MTTSSIRALRELTEKLNAPAVNSKVLHKLLDICADAYWIWEVQTGYDYMSDGWQRMFGYNAGELIHHVDTWKSLMPKEDQGKALAAVNAHFDSLGKIPYICDFSIRCKDGTLKPVRATGKVIEWENNRPLIMAGKLQALSKECI